MKEYLSTVGGRPLYSSDIKNLQELALSFAEIFKECESGFVISGCSVSQQNNEYAIAAGYVFLDGKIRHIEASTVSSLQNLKIVAASHEGGTITYNDETEHAQYNEYYAEYQNADSLNIAYIPFDVQKNDWPNLRSVFFNRYSVAKNLSNQTVKDLTIEDFLNVGGLLTAGKGVNLSDDFNVEGTDDGVFFKSKKDGISLWFGNDHNIYYKYNNNVDWSKLCTISLDSDNELKLAFNKVSIAALNVTKQSSGYIGAPIGTIQIFAGPSIKVPDGYLLCNGGEFSIKDYPELYNVIGGTFNNSLSASGYNYNNPVSGKFRVPDLRNRFIVGSGYQYYLGQTGGEASHTLTVGEMPKHRHVYTDDTNARAKFPEVESGFPARAYNKDAKASAEDEGTGTTYYTSYQGNGLAHENRPPFYALVYIIRAK